MATIRLIKYKKHIAYQVDIRVKGYDRVCKSFKGSDAKLLKKQALAWATQVEKQMLDGSFIQENKNQPIKTVKDLIEYFRTNIAPVRYKNQAHKYNCMYDWWIDKIGGIKLKDLTASDISHCKQILISEPIKKNKPRAANTINKYLMCISAVLTFAVDELELITYNPKRKVKCVPKPEGRKRFLSIDELTTFLNACKNDSDIVYLFALIALGTGGRYTEVQTLKVENIDFINSRVYYLDTKNNTSRGVYLENNIMEVLKKYLQDNNITTGYIFKGKRKDQLSFLRGKIYNIIKDIGIENFTIHDMRHTFASYAAMNGASLLDISELLGHKSLTMSRRYSHLTQKHTDNIVKSFVNKMIDI